MSTNINDVIEQLTSFLKTETRTETVVGQPFQLGEYTCVPVIRIGFGLGYGGGEGESEKQGKGGGSGGGAGMGIEPMGFLATHGSEITFIPSRSSYGLTAAFEKLPDLLATFIEKQKESKN